MPDFCAFYGRTNGPFVTVEGVFPVLSCVACLAQRSKEPSPYPELSDAQLRASLDQLPTWVLEQKAAANRRVIAEMGERLARGQPIARMYRRGGLSWLERQATIAEQLIAVRQANGLAP